MIGDFVVVGAAGALRALAGNCSPVLALRQSVISFRA